MAEPVKELEPVAPTKTYGLMALMRGRTPLAAREPEGTVMTWPYLLFLELTASLVVLFVLHLLALLFNAPLEERANPAHPPNPAKAPWYFLGLQELVSYSAFWGGVALPALGVICLILLPYLDRNPSRRPRDRKLAIVVFTLFVVGWVVLIVIGEFFRGPNWAWSPPWGRL